MSFVALLAVMSTGLPPGAMQLASADLGVHAVLYDAEGRQHTVVGNFAIASPLNDLSTGLDQPADVALTRVLARTLENEASSLGILPEYVAYLVWSRVEFFDDGGFAAFANPVLNGVPFADAEKSCVGNIQTWELTGVNSISLAWLDGRIRPRRLFSPSSLGSPSQFRL